MNNTQMIFAVGQLIAICVAMAFMYLLVRYVPVRVLETQVDPPPNAHYIMLSSTAETLEPETAEAIRQQKIAEIFYHALTFNDGYCSVRALHKIIDQQWNSHYDKFPEYKKHWAISRVFVEEAVMEFDYLKSGKVIELSSTESNEPRAVVYVLLPAETNGGTTRRLHAVESLVDSFLPKPPPPPVEKPVEKPKAKLVEPAEDFLWVTNGDNSDTEGVLNPAAPLPIPAKSNGYHQQPLAG